VRARRIDLYMVFHLFGYLGVVMLYLICRHALRHRQGPFGQQGHQTFDMEKALAEHPEYFTFNGDKIESIEVFFGLGEGAPILMGDGEMDPACSPRAGRTPSPRRWGRTCPAPGTSCRSARCSRRSGTARWGNDS